MPVTERTIAVYAGGIAELGDGCQLVLFDFPLINGKIASMLIPYTNPTIYGGDLVEIALTPQGAAFNGASAVRYRVNDGEWFPTTIPHHRHDMDTLNSAALRAIRDLEKYQDQQKG